MTDRGWLDTRVRKGDAYGTVVDDWNSWIRTLTVKMDNGTKDTIVMNNVGPDNPAVHEWEWFCVTPEYEKWYRF